LVVKICLAHGLIITTPVKTEVVVISSESETEDETKEKKNKIDAELQVALDDLFRPDTPINSPGTTPVQDERVQNNKETKEYMKRKIITYEDVTAMKIFKYQSYINQMDLSDISDCDCDCESEGDKAVSYSNRMEIAALLDNQSSELQ
jgi:hypothetical protein